MTLASERFFETYNKLPKDVQRAMFSSLTSDRIFEIGSKHGLAIDRMGLLSQEIGVVLLGEKRASQFVENLQKALGLNHEKAYEIAQDVNHSIFYEIRENLKKIHGVPVTEALIPEKPLEIPTPAAAAAPQPQAPKSPAAPSAAATLMQMPKSHIAPNRTTEAPKPPATQSPTAPTLRVTVTPSAPAAPLIQPRPIAAQPTANAVTAGGPTYWRIPDMAKRGAAPTRPVAPMPQRAPSRPNLRVIPITPLSKGLGMRQDINLQPPSPPNIKAEVSFSNGVNHEIEENKKGLLARIEQKEEERALGVRITPVPNHPPKAVLKKLLENEVGAILGGDALVKPPAMLGTNTTETKIEAPAAAPKPPETAPPNLPIAPLMTPPAPQAAAVEPSRPAEKILPVSVPTPPQKTDVAKPPPPLLKIQVPQSPAPKSAGGDPYREPIEG